MQPDLPGKAFSSNKTALIFGGGNGIGLATAKAFAQCGMAVTLADIDLQAGETAAAEINSQGGRALAVHCDVASEISMQTAVTTAEAAFGDVDVVMNNVGVLVSGNPEDIPFSEWQRVIDLNLMFVLRSNAIFLPKFLARGAGHIINTASLAGLFPYSTNRIPYVTAKSAVVGLTESLALHLEPKGVRVSCFCPGPVMTQVTKGMTIWSEDAQMAGPGSQFTVLSAEQAAQRLMDGLLANKIFIATHDAALTEMQAFTADPDTYLRNKMAAIANGELGLPGMPTP